MYSVCLGQLSITREDTPPLRIPATERRNSQPYGRETGGGFAKVNVRLAFAQADLRGLRWKDLVCQPVTGFFEIQGQTGGGSWINLAGFDCSGPRSCCNSILALTATGTAVSSRLPKTVNLDVIFQLLRDQACTTLNNTPTERKQ